MTAERLLHRGNEVGAELRGAPFRVHGPGQGEDALGHLARFRV